MDRLTKKRELLDNIRLIEGTEFEYNEEAIFNEYQKEKENQSSLAIKILSIFGGFLATLTFLGFLAITGIYNSEMAVLLFGITFIILAIWLNKKYDKLIIDTFSIALYIIGFFMFAFGLIEMRIDVNIVTICISLIALLSLFITQNNIFSFISVLTIFGSFFFLIIFNNTYDLIHTYVAGITLLLAYLFLNESKLISINIKISKLYNPSRIGLIISLLFGLVVLGKKHLIPISLNYIWLSVIVLSGVVIYLVHRIMIILELKSLKNRILGYSFSCLILIPLLYAPSIFGAMIIILLSFLVNYKTGLGIGVVSFIYFISQYYYDLSFTLLTKSIILFSLGIVFLLFYGFLFTSKKLDSNEKV